MSIVHASHAAAESYCPPEAEQYLCRCLRLTEADVISAVESRRLRTVTDLMRCTGAGSGCTACHRRIRQFLAAAEQSP